MATSCSWSSDQSTLLTDSLLAELGGPPSRHRRRSNSSASTASVSRACGPGWPSGATLRGRSCRSARSRLRGRFRSDPLRPHRVRGQRPAAAPDPRERAALRAVRRRRRAGRARRPFEHEVVAGGPDAQVSRNGTRAGIETLVFKRDVPKLKELGVTESLETGLSHLRAATCCSRTCRFGSRRATRSAPTASTRYRCGQCSRSRSGGARLRNRPRPANSGSHQARRV
jgi:hypothetical protein